MKCPICGKEVTLQNKQVGTAENGEPIMNQFAICRDCKKQWNLDKQRAKKAAVEKAQASKIQPDKQTASDSTAPIKKITPETKPIPQKKISDAISAGEKAAAEKTDRVKQRTTTNPEKAMKRPAKADSDVPVKRPAKADPDAPVKRPAKADSYVPVKRPVKVDPDAPAKRPKKTNQETEGKPVRKVRTEDPNAVRTAPKKKSAAAQQYGNIPPEKVRTKRELAVKQGYEDMLAADPKSAEAKKRAARKKAEAEEAARSKKAVKETKSSTKNMDTEEGYEDDYYEELPRFRVLRVILGILSLLAGVYFAYTGYQTTSIPYYALGGCMIVSGLLLLILQKSNTLVTYLIPMMLYTASGVFAFLERDDDPILLYASIVSVVLGVIFLILAFSSRGNEEEDYDDWDDEDGDWNDR